jgi:Zn-dependent protease/predicted transcriptional regulator
MDFGFLKKGIKLFSVFGIRITLNYSWFIIFALIVYSLAEGYFRINLPQMSRSTSWIAAIITTILLFVSVLFHELCHSLLAKAHGIETKGISLFIFGGLALMSEEPVEAKTEFKIAIAGPLSSFFLAAVFLVYTVIFKILFETSLTGIISYYLFLINVLLAIFNLIPGFPLDGGRILRAYLWHRTGDYNKATISASKVGKVFATGLIILGLYSMFANHILNGFWFVFIGIFLRHAAVESLRLVNIYQSLKDITVKELIASNTKNVDQEETINNLATNYFLRFRLTSFPVVDGKNFKGMISLSDIKNIPRAKWNKLNVKDVITYASNEDIIYTDKEVVEALKKMLYTGKGSLAVLNKRGEYLGVVTHRDIMTLFKIKTNLNYEQLNV